MIDWFRSWHGAPTDNKWLTIGRRAGCAPGIVSAIVWALLDYASQNTPRGAITNFDIETYSAFSGFEESQVGAIIDALREKGLIENDVFKSWDRRQPKREDDGASERKRQQRERDKKKEKQCPDVSRNVTQYHEASPDVTTDKSRVEENREEQKREEESAASFFTERELKQFRKQAPNLTDKEFQNQVSNCAIWIKAHGSKTPELTLSKWLQRADADKRAANPTPGSHAQASRYSTPEYQRQQEENKRLLKEAMS